MKTKKFAVRIAVATAFVLAAGVSIAVVSPQRLHKSAATPAVRLPTIVVRPDAQDAITAQSADLKLDGKTDSTQAAL